MSGKRSNLTLLVGIFCLIGGMLGAGLTYRSMRSENLTHASTGELSIPFADTSSSATVRFQPYRAGVYGVYLAPSAPGEQPCPPESAARDLARFDGIIDFAVAEHDGRIVLTKSVGPGEMRDLRPGKNGWILIDSLPVAVAPESSWSLLVVWCPGAENAPACPWSVFLLPPQEYEIGEFLRDGMMLLLTFAGMMLAGFILIVVSARHRRGF